MITTENGNLNVASPGDITFQAGDGGEIQFLTATGESMVVGQQGDKVGHRVFAILHFPCSCMHCQAIGVAFL